MTIEQKPLFSEPTVVGGLVQQGTTAVERRAPAPLAVPQDGLGQVFDLLRRALDSGVSVDAIKELKALVNEEQDRAAAREFAQAFAVFQQACPSVHKSSTAEIVTKSGSKFKYSYAELDEIVDTIRPHLSASRLAFSFDSSVSERMLTCVCTLRHEGGHSVKASFSLPTESSSAMSEQQKYAAALSFAQRKSLTSVLGLVTTDDDPRTITNTEKVTDDQAMTLVALIEEVAADFDKFLAYMGVKSLPDILATDYGRAVRALEQKRAKA